MAQSFNTNITQAAVAYAKLLKVKVTASSLKRSIEENSNYPSLLSLCETFSKYNIDNRAFQMPAENFDNLEPPFIAYINMPGAGNDFVVVTGVREKEVDYIYKKQKSQSSTKEEFLQRYQKIVLFAEGDEKSTEPGFGQKLKEERRSKIKKYLWIAFAITLATIASIINIPAHSAVAFSSIILIKIAGTTLTVLLLIFETDKNNALVKDICSAGAKTNCEAVLESKASKIMGISWGELGFFYFASTGCWLLYPGTDFSDKIIWISIANAFAAPYILFSVYYQWRVVKQWCPLCLTVQLILGLELLWGICNCWSVPHSSFLALFERSVLMNLTVPFLGLSITILAWFRLKPMLARAKDHDLLLTAYKRLQYNPDIFYSLLQKQEQAAEGWQQLGIDIGNPAATTVITKVCNPYCGPCALAHPKLEEIVNNNKNVRLKIIFTSTNNGYDRGAVVVKHLLAIAAEGNGIKTQQALADWYLPDKKEYELFAANYPVNGELKQQDEKIEAMSRWCGTGGIEYTPTIFINGFMMPENYKVEELVNVI